MKVEQFIAVLSPKNRSRQNKIYIKKGTDWNGDYLEIDSADWMGSNKEEIPQGLYHHIINNCILWKTVEGAQLCLKQGVKRNEGMEGNVWRLVYYKRKDGRAALNRKIDCVVVQRKVGSKV